MPHINSVGDYCHGVGGSYINRNNVVFTISGVPQAGGAMGWMDDDTIAFASGMDGIIPGEWIASKWVVSTGVVSRLNPATPSGANVGYAGGGHAAWWWGTSYPGGSGLHATTGFRKPLAGLLGMGPDAAIGYKPSYQSNGPTKVHELDGSEWTLTSGHAYDLRLLGAHRAFFHDQTGWVAIGVPMPSFLPGPIYFAYLFPIGTTWWVGYQNPNYGTIAHPYNEPGVGYRFVAPGINAWVAFRALTANTFRVVWANSEAEQAGQMTALTVDVAGVPPGPILDGGLGGGVLVPPVPGHLGPRARIAPRPVVRHQYPHVDGIEDWRAQQTTRLLWDRVFDLEERLQSTESTTGDLVDISNSQDDHLTVLAASALGTESLIQIAHGAGGSASGGGTAVPSNIPQPPDLSAALADVLTRLRADGETVDGDIIERGKVLRQFAWEHKDDTPYGFGLLAKSGGNAWEGCSTDWVCYGYATDFIMADVVSTSGPLTTTGWGRFQLHFPQDEWVSVTADPGYL